MLAERARIDKSKTSVWNGGEKKTSRPGREFRRRVRWLILSPVTRSPGSAGTTDSWHIHSKSESCASKVTDSKTIEDTFYVELATTPTFISFDQTNFTSQLCIYTLLVNLVICHEKTYLGKQLRLIAREEKYISVGPVGPPGSLAAECWYLPIYALLGASALHLPSVQSSSVHYL